MFPDKAFFINSNINTSKLPTAIKHPYKIVVTANPDLTPPPDALARLKQLKPNLAFVRVKYLPNNKPIMDLIKNLIANKFTVVITNQRFNSKATLLKFTDPMYYTFSCSRFRLSKPELKKLITLTARHPKQLFICDKAGTGCQGCGLCSKLTTNQELPITSLNLSSSGICPFNCPDCYAKTMQNFSISTGHTPINFDQIKQNSKQAGKLEHIKRNLK